MIILILVLIRAMVVVGDDDNSADGKTVDVDSGDKGSTNSGDGSSGWK